MRPFKTRTQASRRQHRVARVAAWTRRSLVAAGVATNTSPSVARSQWRCLSSQPSNPSQPPDVRPGFSSASLRQISRKAASRTGIFSPSIVLSEVVSTSQAGLGRPSESFLKLHNLPRRFRKCSSSSASDNPGSTVQQPMCSGSSPQTTDLQSAEGMVSHISSCEYCGHSYSYDGRVRSLSATERDDDDRMSFQCAGDTDGLVMTENACDPKVKAKLRRPAVSLPRYTDDDMLSTEHEASICWTTERFPVPEILSATGSNAVLPTDAHLRQPWAKMRSRTVSSNELFTRLAVAMKIPSDRSRLSSTSRLSHPIVPYSHKTLGRSSGFGAAIEESSACNSIRSSSAVRQRRASIPRSFKALFSGPIPGRGAGLRKPSYVRIAREAVADGPEWL